jgi:glutamine amidotransferase
VAEVIALVDYGAGNLRSVANALKAAGAEGVAVTADPGVVRAADRIVLPGVGAFKACIEALHGVPVEELRRRREVRAAEEAARKAAGEVMAPTGTAAQSVI